MLLRQVQQGVVQRLRCTGIECRTQWFDILGTGRGRWFKVPTRDGVWEDGVVENPGDRIGGGGAGGGRTVGRGGGVKACNRNLRWLHGLSTDSSDMEFGIDLSDVDASCQKWTR